MVYYSKLIYLFTHIYLFRDPVTNLKISSLLI